jgi:hypothetical protein
VPHKIVPGGNLATLKNTSTLGKGSTQTKKVGVFLKAHERTPGACRPGSSTDTFSLTLAVADDEGHPIQVEDGTRTGLTCDRRIGQQKFWVTYRVENCAGGGAPDDRRSKGEVIVTATTEADGALTDSLEAKRTLKCER